MSETLNFGQALELAKEGRLITRKGWNGKGMFVFQRPEDTLDKDIVVNVVKSVPKELKDYFSTVEVDKIKFTSYLCMKAADGSIVNGWLASQTDMLADDWMRFEKV